MPYAENVRLIGYHDLEGRPGFKLAMQEVEGRFYLYMGHLWHSGWSVLDVTDPRAPKQCAWLPGPPNTWTLQIQVADGTMITSLEPIPAAWGGDPSGPPADEGIVIWDVREPETPRRLGQWRSGANGTHRNYYDGGPYVHVATGLPGFEGRLYAVIDIERPEHPREVGRWWWPGQNRAKGEQFTVSEAKKLISLHGAPYVEGRRAYCSWAGAGLVILDISDPRAPALCGVLPVSPPLGSRIAVHTAVPLPERRLVIVNSEAIEERCAEPLNFTGIADLTDETVPRLISIFPLPEPPPAYPVRDFADRGGRFGPHNQHQPQHQRCLQASDKYVYMTYFNAGLQIFDISNPRLPHIAGYYIPDDPVERRGPLPRELVVQTEDLLVDRRGYVYMTEKNSGLYVLEFDHVAVGIGPEPATR
jgi:hypothetical protein